MNVNMSGLKKLGYQQITGLSTAQSLTVPAGTSLAVITPETKDVRWRDDGSAPTASVGMPLTAGATLFYDEAALGTLQFIEQAASARLNISYYGPN